MSTARMTTVARPYAVAAFEYALANKDISAWEIFLDEAQQIANNPAVQQLLKNPKITTQEHGDLFCDVLSKVLSENTQNFLRLLAEKRRLAVLPDIYYLFKTYQAEHAKSIEVEVRSAVPLTEKYQERLIKALTKRFDRKVSLNCKIDEYLLGGVIISAGDTVIDGSVRGKLNRLVESLSL